jgi:RNA polymerase sigma-70 factor (ECF subfamily)
MTTATFPVFFPFAKTKDPAGPATLIARLQRGERAALGEAYDLHHTAIRAFARRLTGDEHVAEDLVHEVFVSLPSAIARFEGACSLQTFLFSIAVNHARHHVRSAVRRRAAMGKLALEPEAPVSQNTPEQVATRKELAQALNRALDQLPIEQRVAFVLCEVEEKSSPEVAQIVGVPEATVRTRLYHARQKLRDMLAREGFR